MTNVLLIAVAPPLERTVLVDAVRRIHETGATVRLACFFDVEPLALDPGIAEVHSFAPKQSEDARFRRKVQRAQQGRRPWLYARRSGWIQRYARQADLLVALDPRAVNTVWELAQRNSRATAVSGTAPALRVLTRSSTTGSGGASAPGGIGQFGRRLRLTTLIGVRGARRLVVDTGRNTLLNATGTQVMRMPAGAWLWSRALQAPHIPDRLRSKVALRVHTSMVRAGRSSIAASTSAAVVTRMRGAEARAALLADEALAELDLGRVPTGLRAAVAAQLAYAESRVGKDPGRAVESLHLAWELLTHRVLHQDRLQSPLVADPAAFLGPVRASAVARRLFAPRGRAAGPEPAPTGRPLRLLLAVPVLDGDAETLRRLCAELAGVEVRVLEVNAGPEGPNVSRDIKPVMEEILTGTSPFGARIGEWLQPHLEWADTVLIDRCRAAAALCTLQDPGTTRVVVRLNGPEIFEVWPHLVDFSRVDSVVLPSAHLRDLAGTVLPQLTVAGAPRLDVIGVPQDLRSFDRPKPPEARFTVGLVGFNAVTKDPRWAVEALRELRKRDDRYRLSMIGPGLSAKLSAAAKQYSDRLRRDFAEFEASGAIERAGDDLAQALTGMGVILDSSVYTGFPDVLVAGAASGAVPLTRDWPAFAGKSQGAGTLLPAEWVAATPAEVAERVLAATATEERWRKLGREAAAHAYASWDWPIVRDGYGRLLGLAVDASAGPGRSAPQRN
ncbi:glycosyltransferase family 1 protein [Plantactinospora sp. WMMC1484]|uniref:glycosyltransferase family 1 protein n=1 Tax=Plantactinospora sp. WMMC1484 TaxID=3404122 RepID=UPI003BF49DE7